MTKKNVDISKLENCQRLGFGPRYTDTLDKELDKKRENDG